MNIDSLPHVLRAALDGKRHLLAKSDAFRVLNGAASGTPGLAAEIFGAHCVTYAYDGAWIGALRAVAPEWIREFGWESLLIKDRSRPGDGERGEGITAAGSPPESLVVREGSLRFRIELRHPRNVGLFLDARTLRGELGRGSEGKRVLNLFAYTCSLGIAAAAGGAEETVNVDVSRRYLEWGRENLRLNALPEARCRFQRMDAERYLDWAAGKNLAFDRVILDPPSFSRSDGAVFRFEDDYFRLAGKAAALCSPGGMVYAATNFSGIQAPDFSRRLGQAVVSAGRRTLDIAHIPLPPDFDVDPRSPARPEGNALIFRATVE